MSFTLHRGHAPLLVSVPHAGTQLPAELVPRLVDRAREVEDTDWHLERLYAFVRELGASLIVPVESRIVVDLNRSPDNQPMYPGRNNTELCPTRFFTGEPIYREGMAPDDAEVRARVAAHWQPYHDALREELERLRATHGHAVLFDAHSIKGELPWLFEGRLPDLNLGTVEGRSCAPTLRAAVYGVFERQHTYSHVLDGRFKGGQITRHFGQPEHGVHTIQLEMAWRAYMDEERPYRWHPDKAAAITPLLREMVQAMLEWRPA
ncbi:MAG: N-formylglutamate deformylase HutG [Pseudomonadota bacterium]|jgi:N-formylglutamate deformylase